MNLAAVILAPALALLAAPVTTMPIPQQVRMHLIQLSTKAEDTSLAEFTKTTQAILTCDQARVVAQKEKLRFVQNPSITLSELPNALQSVVEPLPVGKPTPVFGREDKEFRVLIVCRRETVSDSDTN